MTRSGSLIMALLLALPLSARADERDAGEHDGARADVEGDAGQRESAQDDREDGHEPFDLADHGDAPRGSVDKSEQKRDVANSPETNVPQIIERMPKAVQNVVDQMVEARDPPLRFLTTVLDLTRARFGSGTSWLPDDSPLFAVMPTKGRWAFLASGNVYTGYDYFSSKRGDRRFMGRNNLSFTVIRPFRTSEVMGRAMVSFEPFTVGKRGYPLIAATGNTAEGVPLHDRQHAFEFFRELALYYAKEINGRWAFALYLALSGEPALGPGTFTHRISANPDPLAPITFQWQDGTQTSYGVMTFGAFKRDLKLEASWFNGREPGERRYGLDLVRMPDSASARVTWNPRSAWSTQISYGYLRSPLRLTPDVTHYRFSSSATYSSFRGKPRGWAGTLAAAERLTSRGRASAALLAEAYWSIDGHHSLFGRAELVQKSGVELVLPEPTSETYAVGTLVAGYIYFVRPIISLEPGIGVRASVSPLARELEEAYGTRLPLGVMVYGQLRTAALPLDPRQ